MSKRNRALPKGCYLVLSSQIATFDFLIEVIVILMFVNSKDSKRNKAMQKKPVALDFSS